MFSCVRCNCDVDVEDLLENGHCADCIDELEAEFGDHLFDGPDDLEYSEIPFGELVDDRDPDELWGDGFGDGF